MSTSLIIIAVVVAAVFFLGRGFRSRSPEEPRNGDGHSSHHQGTHNHSKESSDHSHKHGCC